MNTNKFNRRNRIWQVCHWSDCQKTGEQSALVFSSSVSVLRERDLAVLALVLRVFCAELSHSYIIYACLNCLMRLSTVSANNARFFWYKIIIEFLLQESFRSNGIIIR